MLAFLLDENLPRKLLQGLIHREPTLDAVRIQDLGLMGQSDPEILDWAANQNRVLVSRDRETLVGFAIDRITASLPMPGLIIIDDHRTLNEIIDDLLLLAICDDTDEVVNQIRYLPL